MIPKEFEYTAPTSVEEALAALRDNEDAKLLAGGHSLIPLLKLRLAAPALLVDLGRIDSLKSGTASASGIEIGAMVTYQSLVNSQQLAQSHPLIGETAAAVGDIQVRARGTLGGSLAHADPAADMTAAMLALNATMVVSHMNGTVSTREIPASEFFVDLLTTSLEPTELLSAIRIPAMAAGSGSAYVKIRNKASHYAVAGAAAVLTVAEDGVCSNASVALTGVGATPFRLSGLEDALKGSRLEQNDFSAVDGMLNNLDIQWMSDLYGSEEYRRHLAGIVVRRALETAKSRIKA